MTLVSSEFPSSHYKGILKKLVRDDDAFARAETKLTSLEMISVARYAGSQP